MIACQACGHSNPLGRVFCQKCGTKLDLSKVRAPGSGESGGGITVGVKKDDEKTKKKSALRRAIHIFDAVLVVALVLFVVLIWQEPPVKNVLNSPSEGDRVKLDRDKLEFAMNTKRKFTLTMTDIGLNSYLASISDITKPETSGTFRTDKIVVLPEQGLVNVVSIRKIVIGGWSKNIVMQFVGEPVIDGGEFRFRPVRGSIGKLPVPSFVMGLYENNFARLFQQFSSERGLLGKLSDIQVEPGKITLVYEPPKPSS